MQTSRKPSVSPPTWFDNQNQPNISSCMSLLATNGGTVRAGVVAKRLGVSPDVVDRLRVAGRLLAIPQAQGFAYPVCQFDGRSVLAGFLSTLQALGDADPWTHIIFLLTPDTQLGSLCPLDALRAGAHADVMRVARAYSTNTATERAPVGPAHRRRA